MERIITYSEAIQEGTAQEMERDSGVIVMGIGADDHMGVYGTTRGLKERFGGSRVFDTPLAEDAMTGIAIGASFAGFRPIHVHIRMDFLILGMNQLLNIAAKARYMYGGRVNVPIVVRGVIGRSWGQGGQHSQALHSLFMHIPGLRVVAPATPYDAKGILIQSIRDDNPVLMVEHRHLHKRTGHVPQEAYTVPFGKARVLKEGTDVTIVGISYMVVESLRAAGFLEEADISAEVIDPVTLSPLDAHTIAGSVRKTGVLVVADNDWTSCGASAEIITQVSEILGPKHPFIFRRLGFAPVVCPTAPNLEDLFYPNASTVAKAAYALVNSDGPEWIPSGKGAVEALEFRGPF